MKVWELRLKLLDFDAQEDVKVANIDTLGDDLWEVKDVYQHAENYSLAGNSPPFVVLSGTD